MIPLAMSKRAKPKQPPTRDDNAKLRDWEAAVKSKVLAFEVEPVSASMAVAHWLPVRYSRRRNAYNYSLPDSSVPETGRAGRRPPRKPIPPPESVR